MSSVAKMTLVIDIAVLLDEGETDTSWVLEEVGRREQELILGGYRFDITRIEEVGSSATETEKGCVHCGLDIQREDGVWTAPGNGSVCDQTGEEHVPA